MSQPTKQKVRKWFHKLLDSKKPPPSPEDIRRQLGWDMKPAKVK